MTDTRRAFLKRTLAGTAGTCLCGSAARLAGVGLLQAPNPVGGIGGPTVDTVYGKVRGASMDGVAIFRGIPYGGATEGANRFLPPVKPQPWTDIRDVTPPANRCYVGGGNGNIFTGGEIGPYFSGGRADAASRTLEPQSENCLVANVITPSLTGRRPVMVYIHGGGFANGSGALTLIADRFVREQDIVLVGVNHRLNVFGYSYWGALSDKYAIGNPGQLDLIAAVKAHARRRLGERWLPEHVGGVSQLIPVALVAGGPSDLAFAGAKSAFDALTSAPVFLANRDVGHYPATYREPRGGAFATVAVAWLKWRLQNDTSAARTFAGDTCGLCRDSKWTVERRDLQ